MKKNAAILVILLVFSIFFASCKGKADNVIFSATATNVPTSTPAADRVVLISGDNPDSWTLQQANFVIQGLAQKSGLEFEVRTNIQSNEITSDIKILVFLNHPQNLGSLSNDAPNTQFIVISNQDWTPSSNVTMIHSDPNSQYFMAGYASVMLADNFRGGALLNAENSERNTAYRNGAKYFCGICNAVITPLNQYPITKELPPTSSAADWINAFNEISLNTIVVVFIPPEAYSADLFNSIVQSGVKVIGISAPPAEAQPAWAGTFLIDGVDPIIDIWDDVIAGKGGKTVYASLYLADTQNGFISPGKQQLLEKTISELQAGRIYTLNPLSE